MNIFGKEYKQVVHAYLDMRLVPFISYVILNPPNFLGFYSLIFQDDKQNKIANFGINVNSDTFLNDLNVFNNELIVYAQNRINYLIDIEKEDKEFKYFIENKKTIEYKITDIFKEEKIYLQYKQDMIKWIAEYDF